MNNQQPSGWAAFAAVILFIVGAFNVTYGLAAIFNDEILVASGQGVLVFDFTTWGWALLIVGSIMLATSIGLWWVSAWARWLAVLFATISAIVQMGLITAFPLWSILIITLDVVVIYNLTVQKGLTKAT